MNPTCQENRCKQIKRKSGLNQNTRNVIGEGKTIMKFNFQDNVN